MIWWGFVIAVSSASLGGLIIIADMHRPISRAGDGIVLASVAGFAVGMLLMIAGAILKVLA